jgi:hypothetical protein
MSQGGLFINEVQKSTRQERAGVLFVKTVVGKIQRPYTSALSGAGETTAVANSLQGISFICDHQKENLLIENKTSSGNINTLTAETVLGNVAFKSPPKYRQSCMMLLWLSSVPPN